jgi:hypothetical protein
VSCCCERLVAEAGDSLGSQRKGNGCCWKLLPSKGIEDVTVGTGVCVCVCVCVRARMRACVRACVTVNFKV